MPNLIYLNLVKRLPGLHFHFFRISVYSFAAFVLSIGFWYGRHIWFRFSCSFRICIGYVRENSGRGVKCRHYGFKMTNFDQFWPKIGSKRAQIWWKSKMWNVKIFRPFLSKIDKKKTDFCDLNRQKYHKFITSFA